MTLLERWLSDICSDVFHFFGLGGNGSFVTEHPGASGKPGLPFNFP